MTDRDPRTDPMRDAQLVIIAYLCLKTAWLAMALPIVRVPYCWPTRETQESDTVGILEPEEMQPINARPYRVGDQIP